MLENKTILEDLSCLTLRIYICTNKKTTKILDNEVLIYYKIVVRPIIKDAIKLKMFNYVQLKIPDFLQDKTALKRFFFQAN